jgi:hypothetical protein
MNFLTPRCSVDQSLIQLHGIDLGHYKELKVEKYEETANVISNGKEIQTLGVLILCVSKWLMAISVISRVWQEPIAVAHYLGRLHYRQAALTVSRVNRPVKNTHKYSINNNHVY